MLLHWFPKLATLIMLQLQLIKLISEGGFLCAGSLGIKVVSKMSPEILILGR